MIYLSPILLSISANLDKISVSSSYGISKILYLKCFSIIFAILTSMETFISMYTATLILKIFPQPLGNILGAVVLSLIGLYFIVEYIRIKAKHAGYDTSYFITNSIKYADDVESQILIPSHISLKKDIKNIVILSAALTLNNLYISFAASFTNVNISISIFFNFVFTLIIVYLGYYLKNTHISKWFIKYSYLISGIILIITGIYEAFL